MPEDATTPGAQRAARRAELKHLSQERLKHWPNTLEAMRKKKENYMRDKRDQEENARREVDRQEAEIRKQARMETIKRANNMLYDQTDKMKMLKSQMAYSEAIATRKVQMEEKNQRALDEKREAARYHEYIVKNCQRLEEEEQKKIREREKVTEELKKFRSEQIEEVMAKRLAEIAENEAIGAAMRKRAEEQLVEAARDLEEKEKLAKETTANMYRMNEELKVIKLELKEQEAAEAARRDAEVAVIDERNKARKALELRRFEKAQEQRQKIIDAAVEQMMKKGNQEKTIQEKQEKEINDRADRLEAEKQKAAADDWAFTVESRNQQLKAKADAVIAEKALDEKLIAAFKVQSDLAHAREEKKAKDLRESTHQVKSMQYAEGVARSRKKVEDRIANIEEEKLLRDVAGQDDEKFVRKVNETIERFQKEGKPVHTLMKALDYRQPQLIPAVLKKGARTEKN